MNSRPRADRSIRFNRGLNHELLRGWVTPLKVTNNPIAGEARYAGSEEFFKAFTEDLTGLYQLSVLLAGDHEKAERFLPEN